MKTVRAVKPYVLKTLNNDIESRSNDIRLIRIVLEELKLPTDLKALEEIVEDDANILESIRRSRQKAQHDFPLLKTDRTEKKREVKEQEFREYFSG